MYQDVPERRFTLGAYIKSTQLQGQLGEDRDTVLENTKQLELHSKSDEKPWDSDLRSEPKPQTLSPEKH